MAQPPQINSVRTPDKAVVDATRSRRFPSLNLPLVVVVALLAGYGLVVVYSAVYGDPDYSFPRQAALVAAGAVVMIVLWRFDYRRLSEFTTLFLIVNVVLILLPHIPGLGTDAGMGSQSWIKLGPLPQVQPGEFAKITVILLDASVMARYGGRLDDVREYLKALGIMLVPFACIMTQPDLGTGLVYLFIGAVALVVGGARPKFLLVTLAAGIVAVACVFALDEVLAEELGFFGVVVLLGLYLALVLVSFRIAGSAGDLFGLLIVMCVVGMWLFQILENIGMTCGLMPITGIPLPFMSYGSTGTIMNFIMLGLIGSVWAHNTATGKKGSYADTR